MADESIIRDFTTEQLAYLYDLVIEENNYENAVYLSESERSQLEDILNTFYAGDNTLSSAQDQMGYLVDLNTQAGQKLIEIWQQVGGIDQRYQSLFSALKSSMNEYWKAVEKIANMINKDNIMNKQGLAARDLDAIRNIPLDFNSSFQKYSDFCIEDALNQAGITDPQECKDIREFTSNEGYSNAQTVALILAAKTDVDKQALRNLVHYNYAELFATDPTTMSPDMLIVIANHSTILVNSDFPDKWERIQEFANGVSEFTIDENGFLRPNYALEYFNLFQTTLEAQMPGLSTQMLENMEGYDSEGNIIFKEPSYLYEDLQEAIDRMTALGSLWGYGVTQASIAASGNSERFMMDMYPDLEGYKPQLGVYAGFSFSDVTADTNNLLSFNISYLQAMLRGYSDTDPSEYHSLAPEGSDYGQFEGIKAWNSPQMSIKLNKLDGSFDKSIAYINQDLKEIADAKRAATDAYINANISSIVSFAAGKFPGGSEILSALQGFTAIGKELLNWTGDLKALADGTNKLVGLTPEKIKEIETKVGKEGIQRFLTIFSNYKSYQQTLEKLDDDKKKELGNLYNLWFGFQIGTTGTNSLPDGVKKNPYFSDAFPLNWVDYKALFAQEMWDTYGAGVFYPELNTSGGAYAVNNQLTGFSTSSALYTLLKERKFFEDEESPTYQEWINGIEDMSKTEKLAWFGEDPNATLGLGNAITSPGISVSSLTVEQLLDFSEDCSRMATFCNTAGLNVSSPGDAMNSYISKKG